MIDHTGGNKLYYYHFDGLGSVVALSNIDGDVVESYSYDVFGEPSNTSDVNNPYLFTGRRYDDETGLYYYRARYYDSYTGRFLQADPIGYAAGLNVYTYVGNNPVNITDAYGLKWDALDWWGNYFSLNPEVYVDLANPEVDLLTDFQNQPVISEQLDKWENDLMNEVEHVEAVTEYLEKIEEVQIIGGQDSYDFYLGVGVLPPTDPLFPLGGGTLYMDYVGVIEVSGFSVTYDIWINYYYSDAFTDPFDVLNLFSGDFNLWGIGCPYNIIAEWSTHLTESTKPKSTEVGGKK